MDEFDALQSLTSAFAQELHRTAHFNSGADIAKVIEQSETTGAYTLERPSGARLKGVQNVARAQWQEDDWVTIERAAGNWQIVGIATSSADGTVTPPP